MPPKHLFWKKSSMNNSFAIKEKTMISVCTIVKNEEYLIPQYVKRVKNFADEIIIVDNNSSDNSYEIAKELGCIVIKNEEDNFDLGRNKYIEKSSEPWILSLDLDEMILPEHADLLKKYLKEAPKEYKGYFLPSFQYYGNGKWATFYMCRLYQNNKTFEYRSEIHGSIGKSIAENNGEFGFFYSPIHHFDAILSKERNHLKRERNIKLLANKEDCHSLSFLSLEYFALGNVYKALETISKAKKVDNNNTCALDLFKAQMLFLNGEYDEAIRSTDIQINICYQKMDLNDKKSVLYKCMIDSCNVVKANSMYKLGYDKELIEALILEQIEGNTYLPHNYLNLYKLNPEKYADYMKKCVERNPMINDPYIFTKDIGPNIYELQTSFLML